MRQKNETSVVLWNENYVADIQNLNACQSKVKVKVKVNAFVSVKLWDRRNRADLVEPATPCHDAQVVGSCRVSNPLRLTTLAAKSVDFTTAPQHLQISQS